MELKDIKAELDKSVAELRDLLKRQTDEAKAAGTATEATKAKVVEFETKVAELCGTLAKFDERVIAMETKLSRKGAEGAGDGEGFKSLGEIFTAGLGEARGAKAIGLPVEVKGGFAAFFDQMECKLLTSASGSAGQGVQAYQIPGVVAPTQRTARIRDLIPTLPAGTTNAITYPEEFDLVQIYTELASASTAGDATITVDQSSGFEVGSTVTLDRGEVAEESLVVSSINIDANTITFTTNTGNNHAINAAVDSDEFTFTPEAYLKPNLNFRIELKTEPIKTLATGIPASRQILDDFVGLRAHVDMRLMENLKLNEERQILYGNGTSNELTGLMVNTRTQTYAWSSGSVGDSKLDAIRRAITLAAIAEYPPTGIVVHPRNWEEIVLSKGTDGHYLNMQNGAADPIQRIWGLPVIVTTAIAQGFALVGAFGLGVAIWDRMQATIEVFNQHSDFAKRNLVLIQAEERLAMTTYRPEAFVAVEFDSAPV